MASFFQIEEEIASDISRQLQLQLRESPTAWTPRREPANFEAYKAYQSAKIAERKYKDSRERMDFEASRKMYEEASRIEPTYALAYWGLGNLYESRYVQENRLQDFELMGLYYRKSFELDPVLEETNLGMGWVYFYTGEMDSS